MNTRTTSDYTPTRPGSRQENQAINARREMMNAISQRTVREPRRRGLGGALARMTAAKKRA